MSKFLTFLRSLERENNSATLESISRGYSALIEAVGRKLMYHGTNLNNLRSILKQGLIANPRKRYWDESSSTRSDINRLSHESYEGVYLANKPFIALKSAHQRTTDKSGEIGEHLLVIVSIQAATMIPDEDNITFDIFVPIDEALGLHYGANRETTDFPRLEKIVDIYYTYVITRKNRLTQVAEEMMHKWITLTEKKSPTSEFMKSKKPLFEMLVRKYLTRKAAWAIKMMKEGLEKKSFSEEDMKTAEAYLKVDLELPDTAEAEKDIRKITDALVRKLPSTGLEHRKTARIPSSIGFSGSNKIVAIMGITKPELFSKNRVVLIKEYYGKMSDPELKEFRDYLENATHYEWKTVDSK